MMKVLSSGKNYVTKFICKFCVNVDSGLAISVVVAAHSHKITHRTSQI